MNKSKSVKDEMVLMLQRKNKDQEAKIARLKKDNEELQQGTGGAENKIRVLNEMHSQKTKALLKSINLLKKEIQKEKYNQKPDVKFQKIKKLEEDLTQMDIAVNALRRLVSDEDRCNQAIMQEIQKGPPKVRVLGREELKMEIKKYKNMSIKIIKEIQKQGGRVPNYANTLAKEAANPGASAIAAGLKIEKSSEAEENFDGESMFGDQESNLDGEGDIPEKVQQRLDKYEDQISKFNLDIKDKNSKIIELLSECEEIKIQVFARDKSIELQQRQIEELLEELRESKGLENDVKILVQKKMALQDENDRMRDELNNQYIHGEENGDESKELVMINNGLNTQIQQLKAQIQDERQIRQTEVARLKGENLETVKKYRNDNREFLNKEKETEQARNEVLKIKDQMSQRVSQMENDAQRQQRLLQDQKNQIESQLSQVHQEKGNLQESLVNNHNNELQRRDDETERLKKQIEDLKAQANQPAPVPLIVQDLDDEQTPYKSRRSDQASFRGTATKKAELTGEERRKRLRVEKMRIQAEEEADKLKNTVRMQSDLDNLERRRSLSNKHRSKSRGGTSKKDREEQQSEKVNIQNVNKELNQTPPRPATAQQERGRQPAVALQPAAEPIERPKTSGPGNSRERSMYEKKRQRDMQQRMLELEEEKEEAESQAKLEAVLSRKEQFLSKHRQVSRSPLKKRNDQPEEIEFNEELGKSGKSNKSINLMGTQINDVMEESAE